MPVEMASAAVVPLMDTPAVYALGDDDGESVDIPTSWRSSKKHAHASQQTDALACSDQSTQSTSVAAIATQTDDSGRSGQWGSASGQLSGECVAWLATVLHAVERQVLLNAASHAFDGYSVTWDEDRSAVTKLHTLQQQPQSAAFPPSCTAVAWNSTGSLLAVAYSHLQHGGWCSHTSSLALWNIHRRQLRAEQADSVVELASCITALCFHPTMPSVVAVGLHSGQIRVLDVSGGEDELLCSSTIGALQHCEPVTTLSFIPALYHTTATAAAASLDDDSASSASSSAVASLTSHLLVSSSLDGKLLTWSFDNRLSHPLQGALCSPSAHYHGHGSSNAFASLALSALSFSPDHRTYTAATEAGGLLRGLHSQQPRKSGHLKSGELRWEKAAYAYVEAASVVHKFEAKKQIEQHAALQSKSTITVADVFASPVSPSLLYPSLAVSAYACHDGGVNAVRFSPFERSLWLSASDDRSVRLYSVGCERSVWSCPLPSGVAAWDVCWSVSRPLVFACADCEGGVHVYDLLVDVLRPVLQLSTDEQEAGGGGGRAEGAGVVKLRWNTTDGSVLTGVDVRGRAHVWQLGGKLSSVQPGEQRRLEEIAQH